MEIALKCSSANRIIANLSVVPCLDPTFANPQAKREEESEGSICVCVCSGNMLVRKAQQ